MQAIVTKYLCPTDFRGSRIKAAAQAGSVTVGYDHALNLDENHRAAALALARKFKWEGPNYGRLVSGAMPDGNYCHTFDGRNAHDCRQAVMATRLAMIQGDNNGNPHAMDYGRRVAALTDGGPLAGEFDDFKAAAHSNS